jgi:SAM-dependent methyltransferase
LNDLFNDFSGYNLSRDYRNKNQINDKSLIYGEIEFEEFAKLFKFFAKTDDKIFYDLGSGSGKACFAASFLANFKKAIGIEIIPDLYQKSQELKSLAINSKSQFTENAIGLEFINNDFLKEDLSQTDVIFCNSTCFSVEIFNQLTTKFTKLKTGCFLILITKKLALDEFKLIAEEKIGYSWGLATTRIYQKIN